MPNEADHKKDGDVIEVTVKSQKGKFEDTFRKTDTVQAVITAASTKLGFDRGDRFELALEKDRSKALDPGVTLGSLVDKEHEGKKDEDKKAKLMFILTATGSGV
jgi:hypothetical protein